MINRLLGQYISRKTFVHDLDARIKILFVVVFSSVLIAVNGTLKYIFATTIILLLLLLAKVRIKVLLRSLMAFILFYFFILIMYLLFSRENLVSGLYSLWKFLLLICLTVILTSATTHSELVNGIEGILKPLKYIKINPRNIALMVTVTIRFIPAFFLYGQRVREAQASRLSDFRKAKNIRLFVEKVIMRMIKSASTLSDAIESRGFNTGELSATRFRELKFKRKDYLAFFACLLLIAFFMLPF